MSNRYAAVYAMAGKAEMTDDDLHKLVGIVTKKKSLRELDDCELAAVTERLRTMGDEKGRTRRDRNFTHGGNPVTEKQRRKIYMLMKTMGWDWNRVTGLARKMFDTDAVEWLNHAQCSDLIEALKDIGARQSGADQQH